MSTHDVGMKQGINPLTLVKTAYDLTRVRITELAENPKIPSMFRNCSDSKTKLCEKKRRCLMPTFQASEKCEKKSHYGKHSLYFPSQKNQVQIICDSALEADYCVHLEFEPEVERYLVHPGIFKISLEERVYDYTPDFLIETSEVIYYTEVKLDFATLSDRVKAKLRAASNYFNCLGQPLRFADRKTIRQGDYFRNLKYLYLHSFNVGKDEFGDCARQLEALVFPIRLGDLLARRNGPSNRSIYKAMFNRTLTFDCHRPLTLNTQLEGRGDGNQYPESRCPIHSR